MPGAKCTEKADPLISKGERTLCSSLRSTYYGDKRPKLKQILMMGSELWICENNEVWAMVILNGRVYWNFYYNIFNENK
jgi:hypothetical protein